jgi:PAS domain S-box-containing protein
MDEQGLLDAIVNCTILLDKSGRVVNWNSSATTLFGYSKKEVIGWSINFIYSQNYAFPKLIHDLQTNQKRWSEETLIVKKNGSKEYCKSFLSPLSLNEQSKAQALLTIQIDETKKIENTTINQLQQQLEQIEKKLRESELRFHLLAKNATDVISRHTPDGVYLYVSPAGKAAMGYDSHELMGKNFYKYIHHDDANKLKRAFNRRREDTNNKPIVYRLKRREGEFRWFESNIRLIIDEQSRTISEIQLASRDITDRVLDKKARLRGQQLAHIFRLSSMEEMASGMAHEISQPLAALVNYTRGCVRHLENSAHDPNQLKNIMEKAVVQAERAGEIIHRLKNFFCKGQLMKTPCKINNVLRETVSFIKHELIASKTRVEFEFDKNIPVLFIDKIHVQQVMLNLMQNAIEAMQGMHNKEKRIHLQTHRTDADSVEITVRDSGPGFSKDAIHKVFLPFYTTKAHGRGMGLAICRSIIEAHGGQFLINPNPSSNANAAANNLSGIQNAQSYIKFSLPISI